MAQIRYCATQLLSFAALALLAACNDRQNVENGRAGGEEPPERGGVAVLAENSDMALPMPLLIQTAIDGDLQDIMFMSLLQGGWENGRLMRGTTDESPMALARRYEYIGADSTGIRFHMRSDARWSDGRPVTAHDVTWTYQAMGDSLLPSPRRNYVEHLDSVVANNDSTVTFHFERRYPEMLFHTGHAIVAKHVYDGTALAELHSHPSIVQPAENLVVSGAFRIGRWDRGQRIVLVPNPYFLPKPHLEQIVIRIIPDETTRLVELQTGNIDAMRVSSPANLEALRGQAPRIRLESVTKRYSEFVAYNPQVELFADAETRRALGLAIDVPAVIRALHLSEHAEPAASVYSAIFADLQDSALKPLNYDPSRAIQILEGKGWHDADGDGIREKNGKPFRFTLLSNSGNQRRGDLGVLLQSYWRQIGIDARLQQLEFQTLTARLMQKDFEAVIYGWQVSLSPDVSGAWAPGATQNFVSYQNPELRGLIEAALGQTSASRAVPYWKDAARLLAEDQPYTWLYYMDQVVAVRSRLRGTEINTYGAYQNAWEWWISEAEGAGR